MQALVITTHMYVCLYVPQHLAALGPRPYDRVDHLHTDTTI